MFIHCSRQRLLRARNRVGCVAAVALAILAGGCSSGGRGAPAPRDVVLILIDALRADRLSFLGDHNGRTPNLDALASDSVVFARASSPATWCVPAGGSLLTGRWPSYHGAERRLDTQQKPRAIDDDATTLAELLRQHGFATAAFIGNPDELQPTIGFARGFQVFETAPARARGAPLAASVGDWLAQQPGRAFVFASVAELADPELGGARKSAGGLAPEAIAQVSARYDLAVAAADDVVGRILRALRDAGRYDDALIVVTADHGELLGEHGMVGHGRPPFEPEVHVPLLVKYPGRGRAGEWVERRVSTLGVFATVLEATGVGIPWRVQARPLDDLHPVWVEDIDPDGRRLRAGYDGPDVKIISLALPDGEVACSFDLGSDPGELRPDCNVGAASALRTALASFGRRPRPEHTARAVASGTGIAQAAN